LGPVTIALPVTALLVPWACWPSCPAFS